MQKTTKFTQTLQKQNIYKLLHIEISMAKDYNKQKFEDEGILEFVDNFYVLNETKSQATFNLPYKPIRAKNWDKNTRFKITIEPIQSK